MIKFSYTILTISLLTLQTHASHKLPYRKPSLLDQVSPSKDIQKIIVSYLQYDTWASNTPITIDANTPLTAKTSNYGQIRSLEFSPDSKYLGFSGAYRAGIIDANALKIAFTFPSLDQDPGIIYSVGYPAKSPLHQIYTAHRMWDAILFQLIAHITNSSWNGIFEALKMDSCALAYAPEKNYIARATANGITIVSSDTGKKQIEIGIKELPHTINKNIVWDTTTADAIRKKINTHWHVLGSLYKKIVTTNTELYRHVELSVSNWLGKDNHLHNTLFMMSTPDGIIKWQFNKPITSFAYAPDGSCITIGTRTGHLYTYDLVTRNMTALCHELGASINAIVYSRCGQYLAIGVGKQVQIWDVKNNAKLSSYEFLTRVISLCYSCDDNYIAALSVTTIKILDARSCQRIGNIVLDSPATAIQFAPYNTGHLFVGYQNGTIHLYKNIAQLLLE